MALIKRRSAGTSLPIPREEEVRMTKKVVTPKQSTNAVKSAATLKPTAKAATLLEPAKAHRTLTSAEIRDQFLNFMRERGHTIVPSRSNGFLNLFSIHAKCFPIYINKNRI